MCLRQLLFLFLINLSMGQTIKRSLTFVIDNTGSMENDIASAIEAATQVFDTVLNSNSSEIEDFLLVTFNDPEPPVLRIKTRDPEAYKRELQSVTVYGGVDCPELSMSGIELALKESLPRSSVYVLTDASAKDSDKLEAVQNLAISKGSQIDFLLTGRCTLENDDPDFLSYSKLTHATSGQMFHIHEQEVSQILIYVAENVKNPKTVVAYKELQPGYENNVDVPIDSSMREVLISITGNITKLPEIIAPNGGKVPYEVLVNLSNVLIAKVPETVPGIYRLKVGSGSNTKVMVYATTSILFKHGFMAIEPMSIEETATQPISGVKSHLAIQLITENKKATLRSVQLIDLDGNVIAEEPLRLINKKQKLYTTELFMPPNNLFKILIKGYDNMTKKPFTRTSTTPIEPQKPSLVKSEARKPTVKTNSNMVLAYYGASVKVLCMVTGFPKPNSIWVAADGTILPSTESVVAEPYDYLNFLKLDNVTKNDVYTCKASNSLGEKDSTSVNVEVVTEVPEIHRTTSVVRAKKGKDAYIHCKISKGLPRPSMKWFVKYLYSNNFEGIDGSEEILTLRNVNENLSGRYQCVASNDVGKDVQHVDLIVEYPPTIRKGKAYFQSVEGRTTTLPCAAKGVPRPRVDWYLNGVKIISDRKYRIYRDNSLSFQGSISRRGTYTCVASNSVGSASMTVNVDYVGPVTIEPPEESTITKLLGQNLELPCRADGYPAPTIKWLFYKFDDNTTAQTLRTTCSYAGLLRLENLQLDQNGYYICVASNRETSANMTYHVEVHSPPYIEKSVNRALTAVIGDFVKILPCNATGYPKPDITWAKDDLVIASGTEWYDIADDGTLTIRNVDSMSGGWYKCQAINSLGKDVKMYQLNVLPYPEEKTVSNVINMEVGSTRKIECDIPHTPVDIIRWYKNRRLVKSGELTLQNVNMDDNGIYTCRVQRLNGLDPQSKTVFVTVGIKPSFDGEVDTIVNFKENEYDHLICDANGYPVPKITWYDGDTKIDFNETIYEILMTLDNRETTYTCIVSNPFGSINRTFEILSRDCILDIEKDFTKNPPMILDPLRNWPSIRDSELSNYLQIPYGEKLRLHCPGGFMDLPYAEITATCERQDKFRILDNIYKFSNLSCREEVELTVIKTKTQCGNSNSFQEIKVGYTAGETFVDAYEVCWDGNKTAPVYTKHRLQRSLVDKEPEGVTKWHTDDSSPLNLDEAYNCSSQLIDPLGKTSHEGRRCCFKRRQLVNPRDLPAALSQEAAFSNLNVVPQWSTCNSKNWNEVEEKFRHLAKNSYDDLLVWTGAFGNAKVKRSDGTEQERYLIDSSFNIQPVPEYLWKVVQDPYSKSSLAIVQVNIPGLTIADAYKHMKCTDICRDIPWMNSHNWRNSNDGFTFCCGLDEFERAFGLKGVFGEGNGNIFYSPIEIIFA